MKFGRIQDEWKMILNMTKDWEDREKPSVDTAEGATSPSIPMGWQ